MLKLAIGIVITALVLGVAAAVALADRPLDASSSEDAPVAAPPLQAAVQAQPVQGGESSSLQVAPDEDGHLFIGIAVHAVDDEAARELGHRGLLFVWGLGPSRGTIKLAESSRKRSVSGGIASFTKASTEIAQTVKTAINSRGAM